MGLSCQAVYGAVSTIRMAILSHTEDALNPLFGLIELHESYFRRRCKGNRGRGAAGIVPVLGILRRVGQIHVSVVPISAATLLKLSIKNVLRNSVVYTDRFGSYDSLMFCGYRHLKVDHQM